MFEIGARVRTRPVPSGGHTRLPGYLANKRGVVTAYLGSFPLPDDHVRDPQHPRADDLYTVAFEAPSLFEERSDGTVCADLFAHYLESDR